MSAKKRIIVNGDMALFDCSTFIPKIAIPPVVIGSITASGKATINELPICLDGDEKTVIVPMAYQKLPVHVSPGSGMFKITALNPAQKTKKTEHNGKPIITKGKNFKAEYDVVAPAINPAIGEPDGEIKKLNGKGLFPSPINQKVIAG